MPWKALNLSIDGYLQPCCMIERGLTKYSSAADIPIYQNSPALNDLKSRMLSGHPVPECASCQQEESKGIFSTRQASHKRYESQGDESLGELEISLTNNCNLDCVMCSPRFSSRWESTGRKLEKKLSWYRSDGKDRRFSLNTSAIEELIPLFEQVSMVRLIGGEPVLSPAFMPLLRLWRRFGADKELSVTSNATLFNESHFEAFEQAPGLSLSCSVDGIGETFAWIRGSSWAKVESTLFRLRNSNVRFQIGPTIQLANAFNVLELYHWGLENRIRVRLNHFLRYPHHLALSMLPKPALQELRGKLENIKPSDSALYQNYLLKNPSQSDSPLTKKALDIVLHFDKARGRRLGDIDKRYDYLYRNDSYSNLDPSTTATASSPHEL